MTERAKLAQDFHDQGYNCAQAVVCAYCDLVGLDKETAYKMSEGFGFGMGCMETVSYTHLDVYKRQLHQCRHGALCMQVAGVDRLAGVAVCH